jgi:hypothetical protein
MLPRKRTTTADDVLTADRHSFYCTQCETAVGSLEEDARAGLTLRISELGEGGAWLARRWQGHSPDVKLWQYFCPHCGSAISVEQHLTIETMPWTDSLARTRPT